MISIELRDAWAEVAYNQYKRKVGRDFCPSPQSFKGYLQAFFKREAFRDATDETLGQNYAEICDALERDFSSKDAAEPLFNALQGHVFGGEVIPHMKLQICDGAAP